MNLSRRSFGSLINGVKTVEQPASAQTPACHGGRQQGALRGTFRFVLHLAEMVVAMQLGMALFGATLCALLSPYPLLHELLMDFYMVAPMVAVMVWHGHCWHHSAEMSAAMLAGPLVVFACIQLNAGAHLPWLSVPLLHTLSTVTMYAGMLVAMLYRRTDYA